MATSNHRVSAVWRCNKNHEHPLCVLISRAVPPELRCGPDQPSGSGPGNGSGCTLPPDVDYQVERELRGHFQESKRRGFVLIES